MFRNADDSSIPKHCQEYIRKVIERAEAQAPFNADFFTADRVATSAVEGLQAILWMPNRVRY